MPKATLMDDIKTSLARLEEKVEHIQKLSVENRLEIKSLRTQIAMGRVGLRSFIMAGGIIGTVFALLQGWINFKGG